MAQINHVYTAAAVVVNKSFHGHNVRKRKQGGVSERAFAREKRLKKFRDV